MTLRLFLNREDLDFSTASDLTPTQTLSLPQTSEVQEIPFKRALWNTTRCVTLFFVDNYGISPSFPPGPFWQPSLHFQHPF